MAGKEISTSEEKAPLKAIPVELKGEEGAQKGPEKAGEKPVKTDIEIKKEAITSSKEELRKKRNIAKEVAEGAKVYQDEVASLEGLEGPGVVPSRPDQKMVKKEDFEQSQKELQEQENKTAKAIEGKMDAELESVKKNGNIDQLDPSDQKKIRTEVVLSSIEPQKLPESVLRAVKGTNGDLLFDPGSKINLENLTRRQKDLILTSEVVKEVVSKVVTDYQNEAKKTQGKPDPNIIKNLQIQLGLTNTDALNLSQLRAGMKSTEFPSDSHIGVVQRVLAESTFLELQETLGDALRWSQIPAGVKQEIVVDSFSYDPAKNNRLIEESISDAKSTLSNIKTEKKEGESNEQFTARVKEKIGVNSTNLEELSQEAKKSGLSPMMRMLADFFGPIGAALGMPFWQEYMSGREGDDDFDDTTSDRWKSDLKGGKADISRGVLQSNKAYLDNGKGLKLEGGSYEQQASSASVAILSNKARYQKVAEATGVPWELIGAIHFRESSLSFNKVLHNGDPLGQKTTRVPAGRGPFSTWEESAIDALNMKGGLGFPEITQTNQLEQVAGYAEKYNGFGYRNKGVSSAYVWAGTEAYTGGMYVADHVFSRTKKDPRPGVMAIVSKLIPESIKSEKRTPDNSVLASTVGAFPKDFASVGAKKNPKTGTTLCSRTAREDLLSVLGRNEDVPAGDAQDVHETYKEGGRGGDMVGSYLPSFSPPENANVADISLTSKSQYGHRVTAYKGPSGWMVLDPYNGGGGKNPQPWDSYVKKNDVRGVAFYQKEISKEESPH